MSLHTHGASTSERSEPRKYPGNVEDLKVWGEHVPNISIHAGTDRCNLGGYSSAGIPKWQCNRGGVLL